MPLEAAAQYGLLTKGKWEATDLARELSTLEPPELYDRFARHILLERGGLRILEGIEQMKLDGIGVTGDSLARFLTDQGFRVIEHNTAINTLRMWLAEAGIFPKERSRAWEINAEARQRVLGLDEAAVARLAGLNDGQRAFVEALCVVRPEGWTPAAEIRDWAEVCGGVRIGRGSLPKEVLIALRNAGIIDFRTRGTGGGKTSELRTTEHFDREVLDPFVRKTVADLDPTLTAYYRKRPEDIFAELKSRDPHTKGIALEAFAIYVMRILGLRFVGWRKRANAEVDALLEGVLGPLATRWQVQCKNTPTGRVRLDDVAKEVGLLPITRATHILFVANCRFSQDAREYTREVMRKTSVGIYLLDKDDFRELQASPGSIATVLRSQAQRMLPEFRPAIYQP